MIESRGRPTAWRPRDKQWFDAYLKRHNKLHVAGPFQCTGIDQNTQVVQAVDRDGDLWAFKLGDFHLVPHVKRKAETQKTAAVSR